MLRSSPAVIAAKQLTQQVLQLMQYLLHNMQSGTTSAVQLPLACLVLLLPVALGDQCFVLKYSMPSNLRKRYCNLCNSYCTSRNLIQQVLYSYRWHALYCRCLSNFVISTMSWNTACQATYATGSAP